MNRVNTDILSTIEKKELFELLSGSTVLVTGATGLIGSALIKTLNAANEEYGFDIKIIGQIRNEEKAKAIFGSIIQNILLTNQFDQPCDYIIHTVSPTASKFFIEHPVETIKASVESTFAVLESARKHKANMVYLSSMEQYGVPYNPRENMSEEKIGIIDHLSVRSSYSESKRMCECMCVSYASEYGVNVKIARLAQTFGAGMSLSDNRMPMQFARAAAERKDIILHTEGKSISNFVYLTDALSGILTIMAHGLPGQAYNVCNDRETRSVKEIAKLVAQEIAEGEIAVRTIIPAQNMGYAADVEMYLDSNKLRKLGWEPEVSMAEAYKRLVETL